MAVQAMAMKCAVLVVMLLSGQGQSLDADQPPPDLYHTKEEPDYTHLMETAPWRVARKWATPAAGSSDVPTRVMHSTRSFPTTSRREEYGAGARGEDASAVEQASGDAEQAEAPLLIAEDIENLERLPPTPTHQECRLLWAGLLEIQDEEAMQADTASAMAHPDNAMPSRISLAARHLCRIRRLLPGRSVNGLVRLGLALPSLLNGIQEAVAEEIEHVLQSRQARRGAKRQREEGEAAEGEEEEVEIEADEEVEPQHEEVAMMQSNRKMAAGRPAAKEEAWRPLTQLEKRRIAEIVKALLEFQTNAEPSLTVLAYVEAPPTLCGCEPESEEDRDLDISLGELRPALLRWLWGNTQAACPGSS